MSYMWCDGVRGSVPYLSHVYIYISLTQPDHNKRVFFQYTSKPSTILTKVRFVIIHIQTTLRYQQPVCANYRYTPPTSTPKRYCDGLKGLRVWCQRMKIQSLGIFHSGHGLIYFNWTSYYKSVYLLWIWLRIFLK